MSSRLLVYACLLVYCLVVWWAVVTFVVRAT